MPAVTRDMISAAHGETMKSGDVILSAELLTRIYRAMRAREPKEGDNPIVCAGGTAKADRHNVEVTGAARLYRAASSD